MTNPVNMSNSDSRNRSLLNICDVSTGLSDVIHHVEERRERIMWTMGSPPPDRCVQCWVVQSVYRVCTECVHGYLGI